MISRTNIPVLAALALTGAATGIYLGKAAVAEINPAYFSEPESRFHSDLTPYRPGEASGYRAGELSQSNLDQALGRGCLGCRAYPEDVVLVQRASTGKLHADPAELSSEPVQIAAAEPLPSPEFAAVERYATYPVTAPAPVETEAPVAVELASAELPAEQPAE